MAYRIFTISDGRVEEGAAVDRFRLSGGTEIPAILVGEEGRGRELGVLPVQGAQPEQVVTAGEIAETRSGRPKLVAADHADDESAAIVILRTPIGFRGSNDHTGDRHEVPCPRRGQEIRYRYACPECGAEPAGDPEVAYRDGWTHPDSGTVPEFDPFPGQILVRGIIAQGDAGRMGAGEQMIAIVPKGAVFRTAYSGRRYGSPKAHYWVFDGKQILVATWEERQVADVF